MNRHLRLCFADAGNGGAGSSSGGGARVFSQSGERADAAAGTSKNLSLGVCSAQPDPSLLHALGPGPSQDHPAGERARTAGVEGETGGKKESRHSQRESERKIITTEREKSHSDVGYCFR